MYFFSHKNKIEKKYRPLVLTLSDSIGITMPFPQKPHQKLIIVILLSC